MYRHSQIKKIYTDVPLWYMYSFSKLAELKKKSNKFKFYFKSAINNLSILKLEMSVYITGIMFWFFLVNLWNSVYSVYKHKLMILDFGLNLNYKLN